VVLRALSHTGRTGRLAAGHRDFATSVEEDIGVGV